MTSEPERAADESVSGHESRRHEVILAVTGGIAAYKACEIVRRLRDRGLRVRVAMSPAATGFVAPLTFAALSGERVVHDLFAVADPERMPHVRWAEAASLFCVAPATADFLAKMAHGIADDFPSTLHLAVSCPVLVAPAMEDDMFRHPTVQANLETLADRGVQIIGPASGSLASGRVGPGRMAEPDAVVDAAIRVLATGPRPRWLRGVRVLVSSGPTEEPLDPMRVLSNRSSGRMGHALAQEAAMLGGEVTLVSGPTSLPAPAAVERVAVGTAEEMAEEVLERSPTQDIVVMAAAVADFRPAEAAADKLKKEGRDRLSLELVRTRDILATLGAVGDGPLLVGFAAETGDPEEGARGKLEAKGCDLVVGNRIGQPGLGPGAVDNAVVIVDRLGGRTTLGPAPKPVVAAAIWDAVRDFRGRAAKDR